MLVEDEDMIRNGIKRSVPWREIGFEIQAEAKQGKDALQQLQEHSIDVVLTDIKMPIMDGVELSKNIRKLYSGIEIVILSGFAEFEYAKEAVSFGAFEYLLKPTNKRKIVEVFTRIKEKLDQRKKEESEMLIHSVVLNEGLERLRFDFITDLLDGKRKFYTNMDEEIMRLELDIVNCNLTSIIIKLSQSMIDATMQQLDNHKKQIREKEILREYQNILVDCLNVVEHNAFAIRNLSEINIIISGSEDFNLTSVKRALKRIVERIQQEVYNLPELSIQIGIGITYPTITHLYKSYTQAQKALEKNFFEQNQLICSFHEGIEYDFEIQWVKEYPKEMNQIIDKVMAGDSESVKEIIQKMFQTFEEKKMNSELIKNYCYVLGVMIKTASYSILKEAREEDFAYRTFENKVKMIMNISELKELMMIVFVAMSEKIRISGAAEQARSNIIIDKAKKYICENYFKKITLECICNELFLSPNYFSYFFKKETGESYMEYLQKIRMEEGKKLLKTSNKKVYEIAEKIGYNDYKYFTMQFKKIVGMSPKEYRNN